MEMDAAEVRPRHRLGVLGWPVAHSRSPAMQNAALAALGMEGWRYQRLPVPPELLLETVRSLGPTGFVGANVTIPHKEGALALADESSTAATEIGAANTLTFAPDGGIAAENTDAPGLIAALESSPRGMSAQVLGAGGSARAVVWALREAGARTVSVWNRTPERAETLARELGARAVRRIERAAMLVNCTAVGLERSASEAEELNPIALTLDQVGEYSYVVDMVYRRGSTALLSAARRHGARTLDGLEILIAQGALSFEMWTGKKAPLDVMRRAVRAEDHSPRSPSL
jgi:shikimate dehydrogenase